MLVKPQTRETHVKVKLKLSLSLTIYHFMKTYGEVDLELHAFLTSPFMEMIG